MEQEIKRQIPNFLTLLRIPMAMMCVYFALAHKPWSLAISLTIFLLASATDFLDGFLARKWKIVSTFGKIADPIADKALILGVFMAFTYNGVVPIFITALIVIREILLTVIRLLLLPKKVVLAARGSGKLKTVIQIGVLVSVYLILIFKSNLKPFVDLDIQHNCIIALAILAMCITVYSGVEFIFYNQRAIKKLV